MTYRLVVEKGKSKGKGLKLQPGAAVIVGRDASCTLRVVDAQASRKHLKVTEKGGEFVHGYTYSGHPVCAAVALKNLDLIEQEGLVQRVRDDIGPYFAEAIKRLESDPLVGEVRTLGFIGAVEIVSKKGTNERFTGKEGKAGPIVRDTCIRNGLMVRGIRDSIVMCPPLIMTHEEIDRMIDIIARSLREAEPALRALKPS